MKTELWPTILEQLCAILPEDKINLWIKPLQVKTQTETALTLEAPNSFYANWIQKHYLDTIKQVANIESITIEVNNNSNNNILPDQKALQPQCTLANNNQRRTKSNHTINKNFTFDRFIIGKHNRLAKSACDQILERPGQLFNPVIIYGGVGVGKTHLLQAVAHEAIKRNPKSKIIYTSSEGFANHFLTALRNKNIQQFRNHYRQADFLLIDDIQFLSGKKSTTEEFFHTFNELQQSGKQIVITSDRPIDQIKDIQECLISRFKGGLVLNIKEPDTETKTAIIQMKCQEDGLQICAEYRKQIAESVHGNIRTIEGLIQKIKAYNNLGNTPVNRMLIEKLLGPFKAYKQSIQVDDIIQVISQNYNVSSSDLCSTRKTRSHLKPRYMAIYLAHQITGKSLGELGMAFGQRTHTSIIASIQKMKEELQKNPVLAQEIDQIKAKILA